MEMLEMEVMLLTEKYSWEDLPGRRRVPPSAVTSSSLATFLKPSSSLTRTPAVPKATVSSVTFRDPLSAERACSNPNPLIDGRKANCNLAYYGQTRPPPPSPGAGRLRATIPGIEGVPNTPANYGGSVAHYQPFPYTYPPGFLYPPYGYMPYGSGYGYPQDVYHRYPSQQYLQGYGGPSATVNSPYPYGQFGLPPHLPTHSHQTFPPYATPSHNMVPYGGIPRMASPYSPHSIPSSSRTQPM